MCAVLTDLLARASLFAELEPGELEALTKAAERRDFARDEVIFAAHEPADGLYVVASDSICAFDRRSRSDSSRINFRAIPGCCSMSRSNSSRRIR